MFHVVALICALGQLPQECNRFTARAVEQIGVANSELDCMRQGALNSGGSIVKPKGDEYEKISCERKS